MIRPTVSVKWATGFYMQSNQKFVYNKHIVLLISSASTGKNHFKGIGMY